MRDGDERRTPNVQRSMSKSGTPFQVGSGGSFGLGKFGRIFSGADAVASCLTGTISFEVKR